MGEQVLRGVSAAPGVVAGRAMVLGSFDDGRLIDEAQRAAELKRAKEALATEIASLEGMARRLRDMARPVDAEIVETGSMMASDPTLLERVETLILESGRSAPAALTAAADEVASVLAALDDPTLAERAADVRSIGRRAAATAAGVELVAGGILIATDLGPADVADLSLGASGAALADGGVTAHAAIVARSLGIPMVVGLGVEALEIANGEEVVLDADGGVIVRRPAASRVEAAHAHGARKQEAREAARRARQEPARTADGHRVTVLVNVATTAEAIEGFEQGAEGIGLLRTELPFLDARDWPSVRRQAELLAPIFARLESRPATVRLFDFGADKTPHFLRGTDKRGIELLLASPDVLRDQLTAIFEAAGGTEVRVLVPMVASAEQLVPIRALVDGRGQLGAMIETREAGADVERIARASDFLSIGTNDLTQNVLGLDRERSKTAPVLDPRVLGIIERTVRAAYEASILVDVCGEAASDPEAMPVLVGLGVDELSVAAARVGLVREAVRGLDYSECRRRAAALLGQA